MRLLITATGSKLWRFRFRLSGTENTFALGGYPRVSLNEARQARDDARRLVEEEVRPAITRTAIDYGQAYIWSDEPLARLSAQLKHR